MRAENAGLTVEEDVNRGAQLLCSSGLAFVLSMSAAAAAAEDGNVELEELIVTATKREQRLIDVPLAVTSIGGADLKASGVRDVRDLIALAPSLNAQTPGGDSDSSLRVRGIGTISTNIGLESSVGIVVDGVARARVGSALSELGDVERIEVLRGPQGTLYGPNTSAGLINIVTASPDEKAISGYLEGAAGNYDYRRIAAAISGPLTETISGRLEAITQRRDGFIYDVNNKTGLNNQDRNFIRGRLRIRPNEDLRIDLIADYTQRNESCCTSIFYLPNANTPRVEAFAQTYGLTAYPSKNPFDRLQGLTPGRENQEDVKDGGLSAEVNWDLGWADLVSVSAYRQWRAWRAQDFDHNGVPLAYIPTDGLKMGLTEYTQETRLQGKTERLDWLVGAWYANQVIDQDFTYAMDKGFVDWNGGAAAFAPGVAALWRPNDYARSIAKQKGETYALFTHNTLKVTDRLSLTGGLRYTINEKSVSLISIAQNPACDAAVRLNNARGISVFCSFFFDSRVDTSAGPARDSRTERALSGTAVVDYAFSDTLKGYLSYSRGYKSGGYNLDRYGFTTPAAPKGSDLSFGDETTDAYEAGLKGEFFDRRVSVNAAIFDQSIKGFQLIERVDLAFIVRRLAEVKSSGAEVEASWQVTDDLKIQQAVTYNDVHYTKDAGNRTFAGRRMESAPTWTWVSSASYSFPISETGLRGFAHADARYVSDQFTNGSTDVLRIQQGYMLVNARVSVVGPDNSWRADLWARNLFDKEYTRRILPSQFGNLGAFLGDPRTYGVTVRKNF